MYRITDEQIDYILNDIRARGVEMEDLQLNLLDHVCCIIERDLETNGDFELFYTTTIGTFYKQHLREIEEETHLLLTFKNYYTMKKAMIVSGSISVAAFIMGSLFKIMHWPGAGALLVSAILVTSLVFLPLVFILKTKEINASRDKLILALGVIVGILYCLSALWLVMHWPGKQIIWLTTLSISFFVLIPAYFFMGIRRAETRINTIVTTILLLAATGIQFTITALRPSPHVYGKVYAYMQNEQVLHRMQQQLKDIPQADMERNMLSLEIQDICEQLKALLLREETGRSSIPADFETTGIIREKGIPEMSSPGPWQAGCFRSLKTKWPGSMH